MHLVSIPVTLPVAIDMGVTLPVAIDMGHQLELIVWFYGSHQMDVEMSLNNAL